MRPINATFYENPDVELGIFENKRLAFVDFRNNKCILTINVAIKKSMKKLLP